MKREPLPARPTIAHLARAMKDTHDCLDAVGARVETLETKIDVIMVALGVQAHQAGEAKPVRRVGLLTPWQLTWRIALGFGPVLMLWQWGVKLGPVVWSFMLAINHAVIGR
jgi:hypothetical protein